ncbi:hypothetical protein PT2222_40248 [Paraburkholderia tropica]
MVGLVIAHDVGTGAPRARTNEQASDYASHRRPLPPQCTNAHTR